MNSISQTRSVAGFGDTRRADVWWLESVAIAAGLIGFIVYATWAAFQGTYYTYGPYLSPFYSPEIFGSSPHSWFGPVPAAWPAWLPFSPSLLILWVPAGFRFTCYYFRGAYYKGIWGDPPGCAVGEARSSYWGERFFPLLIQNIHRYFLYTAMLFIGLHLVDIWHAFWFTDPDTNSTSFGVGLGTIFIILDVVLLSCYVFGCHSLRHFVGGRMNILASAPIRAKAYDCVSCLNRRHMMWGWVSLFWVGFCDFYVRMCAMGIWTDVRLF